VNHENLFKHAFNFVFGVLWGIGALYYVLQFFFALLCVLFGPDVAHIMVGFVGSPLSGIVTPYFAHFARGNEIPFRVN
jgi:hypothetical protein